MVVGSSFFQQSNANRVSTGKIFIVYSVLYTIAFAVLTIIYFEGGDKLRSEFVRTHWEIFMPSVLATAFNAPFLLYVIMADGLFYFVKYQSHQLQKILLAFFLLAAVLWTGYLIFLFSKFPIMWDLVYEYVVLGLTISHSVMVAAISFRHIQKYRKFLSETQRLNAGCTLVDAKTLFGLIVRRRLFTKPIDVPKSRAGNELDNGQLEAFHWDDFYHLNRWIEELRNGGAETVRSEMEARLGIYDAPAGGWAIQPPMGIHPIVDSPKTKNQIKMKLISLHSDDHRQLSEWSKSLRDFSQMEKIEEKKMVADQIAEQMRSRAARYDLTEETRELLSNLGRFGSRLEVPFGETLIDNPKPNDESAPTAIRFGPK